MSLVSDYLTKGGVPHGWTVQNLAWLAQAHTRLAQDQKTDRLQRAAWHRRWALFLTDILDTRYGESH